MNMRLQVTCTAVLLSLTAAQGEHRSVSEILGATHMNPLYNFTDAPVLDEGADVLRHMGSQSIKLWFGPDFATNYPQNHSWPAGPASCTELAQTGYFTDLFSDPHFKVYSLELATFDARYGWQYGDFDSSESNLVYNEVYDLTAHLLDTYNNSGKTFILQNWEGDNALGENASAQKVQSMIDWLNCRQDAITAARDASASSNVWVYGAAECNKVGQPDWEGARCISNVFPYLRMDLYSYSDWYTRYEEDLLLEDMNTIKRFAPDSPAFGHENVMLGEFGLNRTANGEAGNLLSSRTEFEIGMDAGARFAFYWCVYDTNTNKSHGLVLNAEHAGWFGLPVDHTGRYFTQTHHYFRTNALTLNVFEDLAEDFDECAGYSNLVVNTALQEHMDHDPGRFGRSTTDAGLLEYAFTHDVRRFAIMGYEYGGDNAVTVLASKTGALGSYTNVPLRKIQNDPYPGTDWRRVLYKNQSELTSGYRHFIVQLDGATHAWTPQIGSVRFYYERPPDVQTIQFGGRTAHLFDANHQAQVGADELVQFNGADSWGGANGLNGNLNNGDVGTFITSPSTGLRLTTTSATSNTAVNSSTGVLGIKGGDNAKFDSSLGEEWVFAFDRPVVLKQLLIAAVNSDSEEATVTVNGVDISFTRTHADSAASGWDVNRFFHSFDPPLELAAGTEVRFRATQGQIGLEGIVVRAGSLATAYDLWTDIRGLEGTAADWFADPDGNGMNNRRDYALGGTYPSYRLVLTGGSNAVEYVYQRWHDAPARGLTYRLEWTDSLLSNAWSEADIVETGSGFLDASYESVTNHIAADTPQKFIHLEIEAGE